MKKNRFKNIITSVFALLILTGCQDYLTPPETSSVSEANVFGKYSSFQAYIDVVYELVNDPMQQLTSDASFGGEAIGSLGTTTGYSAVRGNYSGFTTRGYFQYDLGGSTGAGIWACGWRGIRMVNIGISNLSMLENSSATEAEKARIRGQLYFLRAFFHFEILSAWGPIPYVDKVLGVDLNLPRFYEYKGKKDYQACTEHIVEDLDIAIENLPITWPSSNDIGHATKFAALGYKARALLYAGSPLMNEYSGNSAIVDVNYMKRAADAAGLLLTIADTAKFSGTCPYPADIDPQQLACSLLPMSKYQQMFATTDGNHPWKQEVIWGKYRANKGNGLFINAGIGRIHAPDKAIFGGNGTMQSVTQNFVDLFEMADGTAYNPSLYDADNTKRWDYRDPRFRQSVYVDRDMAGVDPSTKLDLYTSGGVGAPNVAGKGRTKAADNCLTPYIIHKFWPIGVNGKDGALTTSTLYNSFRFMVPLMRLAEVYLIYAESTNLGYGSPTAKAPGCNYTALDAVNKIRLRAYEGAKFNNVSIACPLATADAPAYQNVSTPGLTPDAFTRLVINECNVETCFEGRYWYNLRRWKIGEQLNQTSIYDLQFDKAWTPSTFTRVEVTKRIFESPKHYWLPFPLAQTQLSKDFPQNTGW